MSQEAAVQYAQIIHGGKSNPDNLQTEAYTGAVGNRTDFAQGAAPTVEEHPMAVLAQMGRLSSFVDIAKRRAKGEKLAPKHEEYYNQVMAAHREAVAARGMKTIANSQKVRAAEQRMQARPNNEAMQAYLASERLRDSIPQIEAQRRTLQTIGKVGSNFGSQGATAGAVEDINYPAQTPEQLDIQRMYGRK